MFYDIKGNNFYCWKIIIKYLIIGDNNFYFVFFYIKYLIFYNEYWNVWNCNVLLIVRKRIWKIILKYCWNYIGIKL